MCGYVEVVRAVPGGGREGERVRDARLTSVRCATNSMVIRFEKNGDVTRGA